MEIMKKLAPPLAEKQYPRAWVLFNKKRWLRERKSRKNIKSHRVNFQRFKNYEITVGVSMSPRSLYFNSQRTVISLCIHFPILKFIIYLFFFSKTTFHLDNLIILQTLIHVNSFTPSPYSTPRILNMMERSIAVHGGHRF